MWTRLREKSVHHEKIRLLAHWALMRQERDVCYNSLITVHAKKGDVNQTEHWLAAECLGRKSQRETIVGRLCDAIGGIMAASG